MSLPTGVTKLEELRAKLFAKAKAEPEFRFYTLYDKIHRSDVLAEALRISKEKRGVPGVDGQSFKEVEEYGEERWLEELQRELQATCTGLQPPRPGRYPCAASLKSPPAQELVELDLNRIPRLHTPAP